MPLFTVESARIAGLKSAAIRKQARDNPPPPPAIPLLEPLPTEVNAFDSRRLARIREQLDLVDSAIRSELTKREPDGQRLNWLASAQERLAEQERQLAGRPLPGSLRPSASKRGRDPVVSAMPLGPAMPAPAPAAAQTTAPTVQVDRVQPVSPVPSKPAGWEYDDPARVQDGAGI